MCSCLGCDRKQYHAGPAPSPSILRESGILSIVSCGSGPLEYRAAACAAIQIQLSQIIDLKLGRLSSFCPPQSHPDKKAEPATGSASSKMSCGRVLERKSTTELHQADEADPKEHQSRSSVGNPAEARNRIVLITRKTAQRVYFVERGT
jgi:hypothetical protein